MHTFTKREENGKTIITKSGITADFEAKDITNHEEWINRQIKELGGKSEIEAAKMKNIEDNHSFIKDMSEQDLFTAHMYQESKAFVKVAGDKIKEYKDLLEEYAKEKVEIEKQTGIKIGVTEATNAEETN